MADNKAAKKRFNFMDLVIIAVTLAFIGAAVYYIVNGISAEKKSYTVAYTVRLELDQSDAGKINEGDNVLSSDGITVIGTVKAIRKEKKAEYVIDRRVTAAEDQTVSSLSVPEKTTETAVTSTSATQENGITEVTSTLTGTAVNTTSAPKQQIIIVPGKDYGTRTGPLVSYRESEDTVIVYVTVIADVKAYDNAYVVNGNRVKVGKSAEFLTPYFYAVGEYYDIASAE